MPSTSGCEPLGDGVVIEKKLKEGEKAESSEEKIEYFNQESDGEAEAGKAGDNPLNLLNKKYDAENPLLNQNNF